MLAYLVSLVLVAPRMPVIPPRVPPPCGPAVEYGTLCVWQPPNMALNLGVSSATERDTEPRSVWLYFANVAQSPIPNPPRFESWTPGSIVLMVYAWEEPYCDPSIEQSPSYPVEIGGIRYCTPEPQP